ncbi:MAG TPA: nitrate reductase [Thermodesulfovibrionales bacterium]|jgi:nitrate reductase gamma subunit|nr:nitrate reductase [Thermodesulfovibrionales bacterium]
MYDFVKDPSIYNFVRGPLVWIAFIVFVGGSIYKIRELLLLAKKEKVVYPYMSLKFTLRSLLHWFIPFASANWRRRPVITIVTFLFHIGLVLLPIFLLAHNILIYESWRVSWWTVPEGLADIMTMIVIGCCFFFFLRRIFAPEVRFVTFADDYLILAIAFLPFISGFLAYHQWLLPHKIMVILHMVFGSLMLIAIPFTRLGHMLYFFLTRSYMGSDQGYRHSKDW